MERGVNAWGPYKQKHIDLMEFVLRRATKMVEGLYEMPYEDRFSVSVVLSLEIIRKHADLVEVFRMLSEVESLLRIIFLMFVSSRSSTRGHSKKISKTQLNFY